MVHKNLKAFIFDLDDTLVVEEASAEAAFLETCELARQHYGIDPATLHTALRRICRSLWHQAPGRAYCVEIGISSWEALWARFDGENTHLQTLRDWVAGYRRDSWHAALLEHGVNDGAFAQRLADRFPEIRRKMHIVYDDVRPMLRRFKESFRLGLLTNGAPDLQREKIDGAGIASYFDSIVISGDIGFGKPNPRIYESMLSRLDVAAAEAVMVGNSLESDIQGAQAAGIRAIWLNRAGRSRNDAIVPDLEIENLWQLQRIID